jgi:hypothetical protein
MRDHPHFITLDLDEVLQQASRGLPATNRTGPRHDLWVTQIASNSLSSSSRPLAVISDGSCTP